MAHPHPDYDPYRPLAPQLKWIIVGIVALVLGAWQIAFHLWFMGLPMLTGHRLNALIAAVLVAGVLLAFFVLIQDYERQLSRCAERMGRKEGSEEASLVSSAIERRAAA